MGQVWKKIQVKKIVRNSGSYSFFFNATNSNGKRKDKSYNVDYFLHVLHTPHRELLFLTPDSDVPRNKHGQHVMSIDLVMDRYNRVHSKNKKLNIKDYLIYAKYSEQLIHEHIDFFNLLTTTN